MKLAACFGPSCAPASATVARMLSAQTARTSHKAFSFVTPWGAIGAVSTSDRFSRVPSIFQGAQARLFVAGVPVSLSTPIGRQLQSAAEGDWDEALRCLQEMDGAFAVMMWHERARKLALLTDHLGMQPVYLHRRTGLVAFASEVSALTSAIVDYEPDPAGWGAFLRFGHTIADLTLARGVVRAPPGSMVIYEPDTDRLSVSSVWDWPQPMPAAAVDNDTVDQLGDRIAGEVQACLVHHPQPIVCLSGGFDSRLIVAALDEVGQHPLALTLAHPDEQFDLDGKLAHRVAREFGLEVIRKTPTADFFSSAAYLDYIRTSGLASPSLHLFIAQLASNLGEGTEAIWDGIFPGCALFPVHQHAGGFETYLKHAAPDDNRLWIAAQQLFQRDFLDHVRQSFLTTLSTERARYSDDESGVSQFVVRNRTRHRIAANPLQAFSNDVLPLTPGSGRPFWNIAGAIPTSVKHGHRLYRRLFERRFPRALRVPAVSAGAIDLFDRRFDLDALLANAATIVQRRPRISGALARCGVAGAGPFWTPSAHVDTCVQALDVTDYALSRTAVERCRAAGRSADGAVESQRELLFYWQVSREIFSRTAAVPAVEPATTELLSAGGAGRGR